MLTVHPCPHIWGVDREVSACPWATSYLLYKAADLAMYRMDMRVFFLDSFPRFTKEQHIPMQGVQHWSLECKCAALLVLWYMPILL